MMYAITHLILAVFEEDHVERDHNVPPLQFSSCPPSTNLGGRAFTPPAIGLHVHVVGKVKVCWPCFVLSSPGSVCYRLVK